MAQLTTYIYPTANGSVGHSVNTGSAYDAIDDTYNAPDDDTTYIYQNVTSTSASTKTSTFTMSGTIPQYDNTSIVSAKLVIRARRDGPDNNTLSCTAKAEVNGNTGSSSSVTLDTTYSNSEFNLTASQFQVGSNSITLTIESKGSLSSKNNDDGQVRITQCYIEVVYNATWNISESVTGKGSVSPNNVTTADPGSNLQFRLSPDSGATVLQVLDNDVDVTSQLVDSSRSIADSDFTITQRGTASYGFTKQTADLTYRSTISGNSARCGVTRFATNFPVDVSITMSLIRPTNTSDYVYLGNEDQEFSTTAGTQSTYRQRWAGSTSTTPQTYTFTVSAGSHFFELYNYHARSNSSRYAEVTFSGTILQGSDKIYNLNNIQTGHTLVFRFSGDTMYIKINGSWVACSKAFKKVNGTWVEQTTLTGLFDTNANYEKGN